MRFSVTHSKISLLVLIGLKKHTLMKNIEKRLFQHGIVIKTNSYLEVKNIYKFNVVCKDKSTKAIMFRPVQLDNGDIILNYEDITQREKIEKKTPK